MATRFKYPWWCRSKVRRSVYLHNWEIDHGLKKGMKMVVRLG